MEREIKDERARQMLDKLRDMHNASELWTTESMPGVAIAPGICRSNYQSGIRDAIIVLFEMFGEEVTNELEETKEA